jgi:transposase
MASRNWLVACRGEFAFMSLIHTCQLCGANSLDYLIELQRHGQNLGARPAEWMPWNYRDALAHAPPVA